MSLPPVDRAIISLPPPFYLVDVESLRRRYDDFTSAFARHFEDFSLAYSYKTNYLPSVLRTLHEKGAWAEVVSDLEFELATRIGVPGDRIVFNGPIKSDRAVRDALMRGTLLHLDSLSEVERVAAILASDSPGVEARIGLRVNVSHPEGAAHRARSRFGLPIDEIHEAIEILGRKNQRVAGLHAHLATKQRSLSHYEVLLAEIGEAAKIVGVDSLDWIDVGGGFGFTPADLDGRSYPTFAQYAECIHDRLASIHPSLAKKKLIAEPGMALVNDALRFVTRVETTKSVGGRNLAFLDASIHTIKPTRHGMNLPARVFDRDGQSKVGDERDWDLVGYTCMDDDFIAIGQRLPALAPGDRVEIKHVGAYTFVFKPPFIRTMPAVFALDGEEISCDAREETLDDLTATLQFGEPS